jgi:predicted nucleotidyltransferase
LAIEYIKALKRQNSSIHPITVKREGAGYNDEKQELTDLQSATAIRNMINGDSDSALNFVPKEAKNIYIQAIENFDMPIYQSNLDTAVISYFRLSSRADSDKIHDAAGGLYNRLCDMSTEATSISSLTSMTETKRFTTARIRRAIWNSYFGVTSSEVKEKPKYTQLLAMNERGRSLLKRIKKTSSFPIITKPADYDTYSDDVVKQVERAQ